MTEFIYAGLYLYRCHCCETKMSCLWKPRSASPFCKCSPVIVKNCHLIFGLYVVCTWNEWVWQPIWVFCSCRGPESFLGYSWMSVDSLVARFFVALSNPAHTLYSNKHHGTLKHLHQRWTWKIDVETFTQKLLVYFMNNYNDFFFTFLLKLIN